MGGDATKRTRAAEPLQDYFRVIRRTNETGLASKRDYEIAFGAMAAEERESWVAPAGFYALLRKRGVSIGRVGVVAGFQPHEELPEELSEELEEINRVVEATPTQVLHMREQGGSAPDLFGVHGRQDCAIVMVVVGDVMASRVRNAAWKPDDDGGWTLSRAALSAARRYGLSKQVYVQMAAQPEVGLLPPADSDRALAARAKDEAHGGLLPGVWISYATVTELAIEGAA